MDYRGVLVGLGNPGPKYDGTRHNVGFAALDLLGEKWNAIPNKGKWQGLYSQTVVEGKKVILVKPLTYMNLSGESVGQAARFYKIPPERVLVIGGGDGGILREIAKHDCVKRIDLCEIDAMVIEAAKKFVPSMSCGFDDPRVAVHIADGSKFVADKESEYDVIIVDSTDPVGPGESLFNAEFYSKMKRALKPDGVIASQSESIYLHPAVIKRLMRINLDLFGSYNYALMLVPTYPTGTIGASVVSCSRDVKNPVREPDASMLAKLRYYTPAIHRASFVLPKFAEDFLKEV